MLPKTILRKLRSITQKSDLTRLVETKPSVARFIKEWLESESVSISDETSIFTMAFNPTYITDAEWISIPNLPILDRCRLYKCCPSASLTIRLWNLFHLTRMMSHSNSLSQSSITLIDRAFISHPTIRSDPAMAEIFHRLLAVKTFALRNLSILDPFTFSADALMTSRESLSFDFKTIDPQFWAELKLAHVSICLWQVKGDMQGIFEEALGGLNEILETLRIDPDHPLWIPIYNGLGNSYDRRIAGDPADNYEKAIASYMSAGRAMQTDPRPASWAANQNNLGLLYRKRIRGDKGENLEKSIVFLETALEAHQRANRGFYAAQTMTNLGVSYTERIMGSRSENLEKAIRFYRLALRHLTQKKYPGYRAWTNHNLGTIYHYLRRGSRAKNIENAIACYESALTFRSQDKNPLEWVITIRNLGLALLMRQRGDLRKNRDRAIDCHTQALLVATRDRFPVEWARTTTLLGQAFAKVFEGDSGDQLDRVAGLHKDALDVLQPDRLPFESRHTAFELGNVLCRQGKFAEAIEAFQVAVRADEFRYRQSFLGRSQSNEIELGSAIYYNLAFCLAQQGECSEALKWLEKGKSRMLTERYHLDRARFDHLTEDERVVYQKLIDRLRALQIEQYIPGRPMSEIIAETGETRRQLDERIAHIQRTDPEFLHSRFDLESIWERFGNRTALLEFDVTQHGTVMFFGINEGGQFNIRPVFNATFTLQDLSRYMAQWAKQQARSRRLRDGRESKEEWGRYISGFMQRLSKDLLLSEAELFSGHTFDHLILIPHLSMHLLPLHLLSIQNGTHSRMLMEEYTISYLPSLSIGGCCDTDGEVRSRTFAGISNPTLDLRWAQREVERIEAFFEEPNRCVLRGAEASPDAVCTLIKQAGYIHFACHAQFNTDEPYRSYLALAAPYHPESVDPVPENVDVRLITHRIVSTPLKLSDIFARLKLDGRPLVVLSACESGLTVQHETSDEFIGFPSGFLYGGASGVLSSLWIVDDESTSLLMEHFYRNIIQLSQTPFEALANAQLAVRAIPEFRNPYYWAAFKMTGG